MAKYKVGDKVRVRKDLVDNDIKYYMEDKCDYWYFFENEMGKFRGTVVTIKVAENNYYFIEGCPLYEWTDEMFAGLAEEKPDKPDKPDKPTPKLKVGDKFVALKANIQAKEKYIGMTFTVANIDPTHPYGVAYGVGREHGCTFYWFEHEVELVKEEPNPATPAAPITVNLNINIDTYANSCWHCRKGGIVDLYLNGRPGICPSCGRVCNVTAKQVEPKSHKPADPWKKETKENKPLTKEELTTLPEGARVFTVWIENGSERWDDDRTRWRIHRNGKLHWEVGTGVVDKFYRNIKVYLEEPERPKETKDDWDEFPF